MAERFKTKYVKLFEIKLLHHYWLDEGGQVYDQISDQNSKSVRLKSYDVRSFLDLSPTGPTANTLTAYGGIAKKTAQGLVVAVPETTVLPNDTVFEWLVTVVDPDFFNYTALTLQPQKIYRLFHAIEKKEYRYKENVPVLSNLTGSSRGIGLNKTLYLSQEFPALKTDDKAEALVSSGNAVKQLNNDQPGATAKIIGAQSKLPVFVHQGDIPVIVPPAGLEGVPQRGVILCEKLPETFFALIKINAVRNDNAAFGIIDNVGRAKRSPPVFQVRFKNRSTFWRYLSKNDGTFKSEEPEPLPLTYYGTIGGKQKPLAGLPKIEMDASKGNRVTRLVSEIFV